MKKLDDSLSAIAKFENEPVTILGLGREGWSSYQFLRRFFPEKDLVLADEKKLNELDDRWQQVVKGNAHANLVQPSAETIEGGFIFKSPGIPPQKIRNWGLDSDQFQLTSNTQLFFEIERELRDSGVDINSVGVTGTKGKSTTANVLYQVLSQTLADSNQDFVLGGNIGTAPLDTFENFNHNHSTTIILELSSHQLSDLSISPCVAVLQAITQEHLDYYETFEQYVKAKQPINKFQVEENITVYNHDNKLATEIGSANPHTIKYAFGLNKDGRNLNAWVEEGWLMIKVDKDESKLVKIDDIPLPGQHNLYNVMPAVILADHFGASAQDIVKAVKNLTGLSHRLEKVGKSGGIAFYNDSLATNPEATIAAIDSFDENIVLIAGGYDRGLDFTKLAEKICNSKVKAVLLLPPSGDRIFDAVDAFRTNNQVDTSLQVKKVNDLTEAVAQAKHLASSGDVILLSPASPSFGEFQDYAERGEKFKQLI